MNDNSRPSFPFALLFFWLKRIFLMWFLIGFVIFIIQILHCGIYHDNERIQAVISLINVMPAAITNVFGGDLLQMDNISGFIAIPYVHPLILLLYMIFAVSVPTRLLTGHVQAGYMELILSRAITKTQVYICTAILTFTGIFTLVALMFLGTAAGTTLYDFGQEIRLFPFFRASVNGALLAGASAGVSLLCAASFRSRGRAVGLAAGYLVVSYLINLFAQWGSFIKFLEPFTFFYYIHPQKILNDPQWPLRDMSVLAAVMIITTLAGGIIWRKRDLPL